MWDYATLFESLLDPNQPLNQLESLLLESNMIPLSTEYLLAGVSALRARSIKPDLQDLPKLLADNCGTGGSGVVKFNISTTAALVAASCGLPVAKHGNRSASGLCGSADLMFALGLPASWSVTAANNLLRSTGLGFYFAPTAHPSLKHLAPVRKALGKRTIFNLLGPLVNPVRPNIQLVGVSSRDYLIPVAEALVSSGVERAAVVCAGTGMDELVVDSDNYIATADSKNRTPVQNVLNGRLYSTNGYSGRNLTSISDFVELFHEILGGHPSYYADNVVLNAAYLLWLSGESGSLDQAVQKSREALACGKVRRFFDSWILQAKGHA